MTTAIGEGKEAPDGGGGGGEMVGGHRRSGTAPMEGPKGKSCKGCLYYSSILKSNGKKPICFGISRSLKQVPGYIIGESEMEASKDGRNLSNFKYTCAGYSVFLDNKDSLSGEQAKPTELPFCVGIELLVDKRATDTGHVPAHIHNKEDAVFHSQPKGSKPSTPAGQEFLHRFGRNAGLVASGVVKNLNRVGNYVKDNLDDILYPYRRRPK